MNISNSAIRTMSADCLILFSHYIDVTMTTTASQITSLTVVYSFFYSDADQRKHQSSASLAFVRGIHRGPVNSPHKGPITRKMFPFDDVIMVRVFPHTVPTKFESPIHDGTWFGLHFAPSTAWSWRYKSHINISKDSTWQIWWPYSQKKCGKPCLISITRSTIFISMRVYCK